jgi:hypothetical protein
MVTILDDHGLIVSTGSARIDADARVIAFTPANTGAMLGYYFDRAGRYVVVDFGEVRLLGRIETQWDGRQRHWLVRTDPPPGPYRSSGYRRSPGLLGLEHDDWRRTAADTRFATPASDPQIPA